MRNIPAYDETILEDNNPEIFKSYLRLLLDILLDLEESISNGKTSEALEKLKRLIDDTQRSIED